jgi:iron(II)-dependent oxidoreductase
VEAGGYDEPRWWTPEGLAWRQSLALACPRYLRRDGAGWQQWRHGQWANLDRALPACHLTQHEALAWCAWARRRLPSEAEWERAACTASDGFTWGQVWEWTCSRFEPYPGFVPHPYVDYSAPWFGSRAVLRGASFGTQPRMRHPRYRNYFPAERNDIFAGFRTCAA